MLNPFFKVQPCPKCNNAVGYMDQFFLGLLFHLSCNRCGQQGSFSLTKKGALAKWNRMSLKHWGILNTGNVKCSNCVFGFAMTDGLYQCASTRVQTHVGTALLIDANTPIKCSQFERIRKR